MIATALLYKETGFNWMPVIPENWETKRAKAIFQERSIKGFPDEPLLSNEAWRLFKILKVSNLLRKMIL